MENAIGLGALGSGEDSTSLIALFRCFFPMYPLGQSVSLTSSTGIINGDFEDELREHTLIAFFKPGALSI